MGVLYFVRHGETDWNREGRLQGRTDIPLNARGRMQACFAARHFAASGALKLPPDALQTMPVVASPMARALETMQLLLGELGLGQKPAGIDDRLCEISFGEWEGKTWPEIRAADPQGAAARDRDRWSHVPPGGESYEMVTERIRPLVDRLPDGSCIVAHGGIARALMVLLTDRSRKDALSMEVWQGKVLRFANRQAEWVPGPGHHG